MIRVSCRTFYSKNKITCIKLPLSHHHIKSANTFPFYQLGLWLGPISEISSCAPLSLLVYKPLFLFFSMSFCFLNHLTSKLSFFAIQFFFPNLSFSSITKLIAWEITMLTSVSIFKINSRLFSFLLATG